jgi:hypothetical protein
VWYSDAAAQRHADRSCSVLSLLNRKIKKKSKGAKNIKPGGNVELGNVSLAT